MLIFVVIYMPRAMKSEISIVIPVYNRAHTLGHTLASIEKQHVWPDEVILVDNNSTDESVDIMTAWQQRQATHGRRVTIAHQPRQGAAAARNMGLSMVTTRYVMFFDSDDEMLPNHVADFARAFAANPGAQIAGRDIEMHMLDGAVKTGYFKARNALFNHIFRGTISTQRVAVATRLVKDVGAWDETLAQWDDYELGLRYLLETPSMVRIPGPPSVITHAQEESLTGTGYIDKRGKWEAALDRCRQHLTDANLTGAIAWLDTRYAILAAQYHNEGYPAEARKLLDGILAITPHPRRLRLLYHHNRIFHRLTWVAARLLFLW